MNGAFKGLKQSDVYLTSYISKKQWQVDSGSFKNLGISKTEAASGSSTYDSFRVSYYEGSLGINPLYRKAEELKETGIPYTDIITIVSQSFPGHTWEETKDLIEQGEYYGGFSGPYDLNLQSTITLQGERRLPSGSILAYSIPRDCFGENIEEGSLTISGSNCNLFDREGLILENSGSGYRVVGDVIYNQGLILLDKAKVTPVSESLGWASIKTINTWNVNCRVRDLEYNYSYNGTITDKNQELLGTSRFTPYITAVGLYNRSGELMAVAKLSKPVRKNDNIDMTFKVNIDVT